MTKKRNLLWKGLLDEVTLDRQEKAYRGISTAFCCLARACSGKLSNTNLTGNSLVQRPLGLCRPPGHAPSYVLVAVSVLSWSQEARGLSDDSC